MIPTIDVETAREALAELPDGTSHGDQTAPAQVYVPPSHLKALHPDNLLVTGMRGAGKTFWWTAFQNRAVRTLVSQQTTRVPIQRTVVRTGFGVKPEPGRYPSKDVLRKLMADGIAPRSVWRTVLAWQVAGVAHELKEPPSLPARVALELRKRPSWATRVALVDGNPEVIDRLFYEMDVECDRQDAYLVTLFDALDRCADDWKEMDRTIRGLLQTALDMRAYRRLRVKVFLRSDQVDESRVADFPDASKVLSSAIELRWPRHELYGLLWHLLANGQYGEHFRSFLTPYDWSTLRVGGQSVFLAPRATFKEEDQRDKFHAIAGKWMGRGPKRGFPYTWIPNHLGDTEGRVSPRSFLAALRKAVDDTKDGHPGHQYALHYDSIKRGAQEASKIRVSEIQEDYPWIDRVLTPLAGMLVPCAFEEIADRWRNEGVLQRLQEEADQDEVKLPPRHGEQGPDGVRTDLELLRVFMRLRDGRVNIPDVFRVGYGLGRRGGVRPIC